MQATIFAKKMTSKDGRNFNRYITKLTKVDGSEVTMPQAERANSHKKGLLDGLMVHKCGRKRTVRGSWLSCVGLK